MRPPRSKGPSRGGALGLCVVVVCVCLFSCMSYLLFVPLLFSSFVLSVLTRSTRTLPFSILPARRQPHSVFGALCMPAPSVCFRTPRHSLGHPGSLTSVHDLKCMRTQTAPLFNVPRGRRGTTTRVVHPYPHGTSRAGNRTWVVVGGVQSANHYTMGLAMPLIAFPF